MNLYELLSAWGDSKEVLRRGGILSTNGRVLVAMIVDPSITQIAVAVLLGISQSAVEKAVSFWTEAGIVSVEKQGRSNVYSVHWNKLYEHPDFATLRVFLEKRD
jgi:DNA-binding transcriptional ArsR family regulator